MRELCGACGCHHDHARGGRETYRPTACIRALGEELDRERYWAADARRAARNEEDRARVIKDQARYIAILEDQLKPFIGRTVPETEPLFSGAPDTAPLFEAEG